MTIADILQAIATATFVGAFAFGIIQVLSARRARREQAAIELIRSLQNGPFSRAWRLVSELPTGLTAEQLDGRGQAVAEAADDMGLAFETLGYLVYRRVVPLKIAEDCVGMVITGAWARLQSWAEASRGRTGNPALMEWFQWLAERLEEQRSPLKSAGAFTTFKDWKP